MTLIIPVGYASHTNTVTSAVAKDLEDFGFSSANIGIADIVHISVYSGDMRYWYDGTVPTASTGHKLNNGNELLLRGRVNIRNLHMIAESTTITLGITLCKG